MAQNKKNLSPGTKVKIVADKIRGHNFRIGSIVTIYGRADKSKDGRYDATNSEGRRMIIGPEDFELIPKKRFKSKVDELMNKMGYEI